GSLDVGVVCELLCGAFENRKPAFAVARIIWSELRECQSQSAKVRLTSGGPCRPYEVRRGIDIGLGERLPSAVLKSRNSVGCQRGVRDVGKRVFRHMAGYAAGDRGPVRTVRKSKAASSGCVTLDALSVEVLHGASPGLLQVRVMASDAIKAGAVGLATATHLYLLRLTERLKAADLEASRDKEYSDIVIE